MKKNIILVLMLFILTGCEADYNLEIMSDGFFEDVYSKFNTSKYDDEELSSFDGIRASGIYAFINDNNEKMNNNIEIDNKNVNFSFNYAYDENNFDNSYLINYCFEEHIFENDDNYYYINLLGDFGCQYADKVNININTDYDVIDTNATRKGNNYSWSLTEKNNKNVDLYIKIAKVNTASKNRGPSKFKIISFIILLILSGITFLLYKKINSDSI